ncbi:hypothetical protein [Arthrobacter psychrolactophilus]
MYGPVFLQRRGAALTGIHALEVPGALGDAHDRFGVERSAQDRGEAPVSEPFLHDHPVGFQTGAQGMDL